MNPKPISIKVGQSKAKKDSRFADVFVDIHEKYSVDRIEFRQYGALVARPFCTAKDPVDIHLTRDGSEIRRFCMKGYDTHSGEFLLVVKVILSCGRFAEVLWDVGFADFWYDEDSQESRLAFQSVPLVTRRKWSLQSSVKPISSRHTFGVELELSDARGVNQSAIAYAITNRSAVRVKAVHSYHRAHDPLSTWKIVHDGSLVCSRHAPGCSKFELVSPILRGEDGLEQCCNVLTALKESSSTTILVNKSMGFHVHVSVEGFTLEEIKKICLNFVKYEQAMDLCMPPSRRTGSSTSNRYFQSCRAGIRNASGTIAKLNGGRHRAIWNCHSLKALCRLMNPEGRYYKLNLQNLVTGRQPTLEFRQHSATANIDKVLAWVRFCVVFVRNSARKPVPDYLKNNLEPKEVFDDLFENLVQCKILNDFYKDRMETLAEEEHHCGSKSCRPTPCCSGCSHGLAMT